MIQTIKQLWKQYSEGRHPLWPATRKAHLALYPTCAACGGKKDLEVHHKIPVSHDPTMELDRNNLITLCGHNKCHFVEGHALDWKAANPHVIADCELRLLRIKWRVKKNVSILSPVDDVIDV